MRKQVLLGMMMFAMGASLIGCGKSDGKTDNATTTITSENQVVNESTEIKKDETKMILRIGLDIVLTPKEV